MQVAIVEAGTADIDAHVAAGQGTGRDAGVFQREPHDLEQQPLLRVHFGRLAR